MADAKQCDNCKAFYGPVSGARPALIVKMDDEDIVIEFRTRVESGVDIHKARRIDLCVLCRLAACKLAIEQGIAPETT